MSYSRVVPRDLFNEANLLKCLGALVIHIQDSRDNLPWEYKHDGTPFEIVQDPNDGSISCANLHVFLDGEELQLFRPLNSRELWGLMARFRGEEYYVFDSNGKVMPNFGFVERQKHG